MKYFEEKVVPHIEPDQQPDPVVHENEFGGFIDAVIDAVENGKMTKVRIVKCKKVCICICPYIPCSTTDAWMNYSSAIAVHHQILSIVPAKVVKKLYEEQWNRHR